MSGSGPVVDSKLTATPDAGARKDPAPAAVAVAAAPGAGAQPPAAAEPTKEQKEKLEQEAAAMAKKEKEEQERAKQLAELELQKHVEMRKGLRPIVWASVVKEGALRYETGCYQSRKDIDEMPYAIDARLVTVTDSDPSLNRRVAVYQRVHDNVESALTLRAVTEDKEPTSDGKPASITVGKMLDDVATFTLVKNASIDLSYKGNVAVIQKSLDNACSAFLALATPVQCPLIELQVPISEEGTGVGPEAVVDAVYLFLKNTSEEKFKGLVVLSAETATDLKKYVECMKIKFPLPIERQMPRMEPAEGGCVML